jgi:hypothetical protein
MDIDFAFQEIDGLHRGLYRGQHERVDEINNRVHQRHFSDQPLEPMFDPRPVPTKYALFPMIERRAQPEIPINRVATHVVESNFNPSTRKYPFSSYLANLDTETMLRNQTVALQRGSEMGVYVPSSSSDLYRGFAPNGSMGTGENTHPELFVRQQYSTHMPAVVTDTHLGKSQLFNHTRVQLRGMGGSV